MKLSESEKRDDEYIEQMFLGNTEESLPLERFSVQQVERIIDTLVEYKEMRMMYTCALKEIQTKLDVLNAEFNTRYKRNPIKFITTRVKSTHSIIDKMKRLNVNFTLENVEKNLNDIAGARVICSYVDDIYKIASALKGQDDIHLIIEKDYIRNPKPNGYRSLHLIVSVPVFFIKQKKELKVEIQIRTIAMDFWASLEHQIKYKKEIPNQQEIITRLKHCADTIAETDMTMYDLRRQIEGTAKSETEESILMEKMKRLDGPII